MTQKTALILSGGGAKGAFQAAAEKYAREVKGYRWNIIAGVSVGALNGLMLAMGKWDRLWEVWNTVSNNQVYTGGFNLWSLIRILFGAKSFYGNAPLQKLIAQELELEKIHADLRIGAVSLQTGEYVQFRGPHPDMHKIVLASTAIPILWEPVDVSAEYPAMVDGGVRNTSPLGDVLADDPDEIVVINCSAQVPVPLPRAPENIQKIGQRTLEIVLNEIFTGDLNEFLRINALVQQAAAQGFTLYHPTSGRPLKYFECKIIEPMIPLGDLLDFTPPTIQRSLQHGWEQAKAVLG